MATLSEQDKLLNADQQKQIQAYKDQWANATTQAERDAAHAGAEAIRNSAGFSGGADGSQVLMDNQPQRVGGQSAEDVQKWVDDYHKANQSYDPNRGHNTWNNGYSVGMNLRSMANYIRQQMDANSKAWAGADAETQAYLHDQNQQLAEILRKASGGAQSTYNEKEGRWETYNSNLGYGTDMSYVDPYLFDKDFRSKVYGQTEADWDKYRNDTDRYYNFVDTRTVRNWNDESSGFTGQYAQFVNGPYSQLMGGANGYINPAVYMDIIGDNFGGEDEYEPVRDENGNIVPQAPALKNNNASDYTRALAGYTENGVILPNVLNGSRDSSKDEDSLYRNMNGSGPNYATSMDAMRDQMWRPEPGDIYNERDFYASAGSGGGGTGAGDLEAYLQQIYAANLASQLAQLEAAYNKNLSQLDETSEKTDANYTEQKRQTTGTSAQQAANWREIANAMGLNSGAFGQGALAQANVLQGNLNTLNTAQATAQADIERQRALLGQEYQLAILEAQANNDFERANALYNEAVRQDEALRQKEQFNAQMQLQYAQMAQNMMGTLISNSGARSTGKSGSPSYNVPSGGYQSLYEAAYASDNPKNYIASNYKDYGLTNSTGLADGYDNWVDTELNNQFKNASSSAINLIQTGGRDYGYLYNALLNQGYSLPVIDSVLSEFGG